MTIVNLYIYILYRYTFYNIIIKLFYILTFGADVFINSYKYTVLFNAFIDMCNVFLPPNFPTFKFKKVFFSILFFYVTC